MSTIQTTKFQEGLNDLHLSEVYSLMLFVLYKTKEIPEYATLSELCFLLDGSNIHRLLTYFAGKTVTFPSENEMTILSAALLLYQYVNLDRIEFSEALNRLVDLTPTQKEKATELYVQIIPIMNNYNIKRPKNKRK